MVRIRDSEDLGGLAIKGITVPWLPSPTPVCIGSGLMALDVVATGDRLKSPRVWAGGSCGNIMIILASLGWKTLPVARLGADAAAGKIAAEFARFDVASDFVRFDEKIKTPVIVEQIKEKAGPASHRFSTTCPHCGSRLPWYRAVTVKTARTLRSVLPDAQVFYFDRAAPGVLELAATARESGALVFFEPPGVKDMKLFRRAIRSSHIVKHSAKTDNGFWKSLGPEDGPVLLVETMGDRGAAYRLRKNHGGWDEWKTMSAFGVERLMDATGSGDWCSAGIIHMLGRSAARGLERITEDGVAQALRFGQALAALNCCFEGARGGMYTLTKTEMMVEVAGIMRRGYIGRPAASQDFECGDFEEAEAVFRDICASCKKDADARGEFKMEER
ncbi:MAG: carbohydrate kinase family protein [Syntrophobacteraceae bacterium]